MRFIIFVSICLLAPLAVAEISGPSPSETYFSAQTFLLTGHSVIRDAPEGQIQHVWQQGELFTSNRKVGPWLRVTGYFPGEGAWVPTAEPLWIRQEYVESYTPPGSRREPPVHPGIDRYIVVDKADFQLTVFEKTEPDSEPQAIYQTTVALGMDRCLSATKGGNCYYTETGDYRVRWKINDENGIEWCIPKSMEAEYSTDIANGQRCFRGSIGTHALNIGGRYAIHGTSNPSSIGKRVSHGCVRARNRDMRKLYNLIDVGDEVFIVDSRQAVTAQVQQ